MPIHDLGYRNWDVPNQSRQRWYVVAETGFRLSLRSRWLRRMLLVAWVPAVMWGIFFFFYEQYIENTPQRSPVMEIVKLFHREFKLDIDLSSRSQVWTTLLFAFFRNSQAFLMVMLIGLVAPTLISQDLRSRAFLIYFSRPLSPGEYIVGKSAVIWTFLVLISTLPALLLYLIGVLLSPDINVIQDTWHLPLRIFLASVFLVIPTTAYALMLSSLGSESRFASFAWFATWIAGEIAFRVIQFVRFEVNVDLSLKPNPSEWTLLSPFQTLTKIQLWAFGGGITFNEVFLSLVLVATVTVLSIIVIYRRVTAPIRV